MSKTDFQNGFALGLVSGGVVEGDRLMQEFWDVYQDKGNRTDYATAFGGAGWNNETFKPKYDIKPTNAYMMFRGCGFVGDLQAYLESLGVVLDFARATNTQYIFNASQRLTRVGRVDVTASTNSIQADSIFNQCRSLERVECFVVNANTKFNTGSFYNCDNLKYVGFEGNISNSLSFQHSSLLTNECVQGIIDHLATITTVQTLTLHPSVVVHEEQKATILSKGWTLVQ